MYERAIFARLNSKPHHVVRPKLHQLGVTGTQVSFRDSRLSCEGLGQAELAETTKA